ncbi:MAG TPA: archease [Candidatus Hodarchaeales archaeon]|nr:archease [Candidatus Hodarchaeales archaeon]
MVLCSKEGSNFSGPSALSKVKYLEDEATADIAYIACGADLAEAFSNAALALYNVIVDLDQITPTLDFSYKWEAEDLPALLYDFLQDLIYFFDTERLLLCQIEAGIEQISPEKFSLIIRGKGEKFSEKTHVAKTLIKAMTFFGLEINNNCVKVTLDI